MPKFFRILACVLSLSGSVVTFSHSSNSLGLGVVVGEPTGFSGKYWLDKRGAVDFSAAYSFNHFMLLTGDYVLHFDNLIKVNGQHLHPYIGVGAILAFAAGSTTAGKGFAGDSNSSFGLGVRVPFGLEWVLASSPLAIFVELVPGIGIVPSTFTLFNGGIGIRYFF